VCAAFLWIQGREVLACFYFLSMAGILAAFSLIRGAVAFPPMHPGDEVETRETGLSEDEFDEP